MYYLYNVFEQVPYTTGTILKKKMTLSSSPFTPMYLRTSIALKTTMVVGPLQKTTTSRDGSGHHDPERLSTTLFVCFDPLGF